MSNAFEDSKVQELTAKYGSENVETMSSEEAESLLEERGRTHGDFFEMAVTASSMKNELNVNDPVLRECAEMICTKLARISAGDETYEDHWLDIVGYATHGLNHVRDRTLYKAQEQEKEWERDMKAQREEKLRKIERMYKPDED